MRTFRELYSSCWQAWSRDHHELTAYGWKPSRRVTQQRLMGDFMWAAFCVQWVTVAWCVVVGKDSSGFFVHKLEVGYTERQMAQAFRWVPDPKTQRDASSFVVDSNAKHVHPRPRGDLVLCDGRCGARLPLPYDFEVRDVVDGLASSAAADRYAVVCGWLVTKSMARSFHFCERCRKGVER